MQLIQDRDGADNFVPTAILPETHFGNVDRYKNAVGTSFTVSKLKFANTLTSKIRSY